MGSPETSFCQDLEAFFRVVELWWQAHKMLKCITLAKNIYHIFLILSIARRLKKAHLESRMSFAENWPRVEYKSRVEGLARPNSGDDF